MRIFKNTWFIRFARAQGISDETLLEAIIRAERGQVDADLGGGVIKQRLARPGQGRAKGYRSIILLREGHRAFFEYGFSCTDLRKVSETTSARTKNRSLRKWPSMSCYFRRPTWTS